MKTIKRLLKFLGIISKDRDEMDNSPLANKSEPETYLKINDARESLTSKITKSPSLPQSYPILLRAEEKLDCNYNSEIKRNDRGVLEEYFFDLASAFFKDKLKKDIEIYFSDLQRIVPDLAIIDSANKLFVVIEIDEPYTIEETGNYLPIHYLGLDDSRNSLLAQKGWNVIRFAEWQIALNPAGCISYIESFISGSESTMETVKRWTKEESLVMIKGQYRNSYLPNEFTLNQRTNSGYSYRSFTIKGIYPRELKGLRWMIVEFPKDYIYDVHGCVIWESSNPTECWILEDQFWEIFKNSDIWKCLQADGWDSMPILILGYLRRLGTLRFEAIGKQNSKFFNLHSKHGFRIVCDDDTLKKIRGYYGAILQLVKAGLIG